MSHIDLNDVDVDGAVREAEEAVGNDTRATFFRKAAITGGTIGSAAFFGGMLPGIAEAAPSKKQDIAILKYALTLEYLEAAFYKEAARDGGLSGQQLEAARLLNTVVGKTIVPDGAFAKPASMVEVLPKVKPFLA